MLNLKNFLKKVVLIHTLIPSVIMASCSDNEKEINNPLPKNLKTDLAQSPNNGVKNPFPTPPPSPAPKNTPGEEKDRDGVLSPSIRAGSFSGIPNIGNTCFMNSALQIIAVLFKDHINNCELRDFINKINNGMELSGMELKTFVNRLPTNSVQLVKEALGGRHQDAEEFIRDLFNKNWISDKVIKVKWMQRLFFKKSNVHHGIYYTEKPASDLIYKIYFGEDGQAKDNSLTLNQRINSQEIEFCRAERGALGLLVGDGREYRQELPSYVENNKHQLEFSTKDNITEEERIKTHFTQIILDNMPPILVIQLARFKHSSVGMEKIGTRVREVKHIRFNTRMGTENFALKGFILHIGGLEGGHYTAYVERMGKWYCADDSIVTEIPLAEAEGIAEQAYLLFYEKQ